MKHEPKISRRRVLASGLSTAALSSVALSSVALSPVVAALMPTPRQGLGPFYPSLKPLDSDTDLVAVAGHGKQAAGQVVHVMGRVVDARGRPAGGARVEIWQCDAFGRYHHPRDAGAEGRGGGDPNFQGYGQTVLAADGAYRFRTIRPVPYPGRAPHIHFAVSGPGFEPLVTQMYVAGEPRNAGDWILNSVGDEAARASLIVDLGPAPEIEPGALRGVFDIVLGGNS